MVDRPRTNAGESPRDQEAERSVRVVIGAVPTAKTAAVERREASALIARRAPRLASVEWLMRLPALRSPGFDSGKKKTGAPVA